MIGPSELPNDMLNCNIFFRFIINTIKKEQRRYCSSNHVRNFSIETDSITIGMLECKIPQISEHCTLSLRNFNVTNKSILVG